MQWPEMKKHLMASIEPFDIPEVELDTPEMRKYLDELRLWSSEKSTELAEIQ